MPEQLKRILAGRSHTARPCGIREKAYIARELAAAGRDAELEAKSSTLSAVAFLAWIARERPRYCYRTLSEFEESCYAEPAGKLERPLMVFARDSMAAGDGDDNLEP